MSQVDYRDPGVVGYAECWKMQQELFDVLIAAKRDGNIEAKPTLILCEHPHVYTLGKSGSQDNMLITDDFLQKIGATFFRIDRGGDITYHGPGQLVGYPILDLDELGLGLKEYVRLLEQTIIETIAEFGIEGERSEGATGVWLQPSQGKGLRKISAIGVRSSHYVTMHGFALNVAPQMEYFSYINPCGFTDRGVTSIKDEIENPPSIERVKEVYTDKFRSVFGVDLKK